MKKIRKYIIVSIFTGALLFSGSVVLGEDIAQTIVPDMVVAGDCPLGMVKVGQTNAVPPRPICQPRESVKIKQEQTSVRQNTEIRTENIKVNIEARNGEVKKNIEEYRENTKQAIELPGWDAKEAMEKMNESQKKRLEELREKAKQRAEEISANIEKAREKAQEKVQKIRETAKKKIEEIKDTRKKESAEKITSQLERINRNWTDHFARVLKHLDEVLQKISSRTQKMKEDGRDVALAETAIVNAQNRIAAAREAVAFQAQKTYVIDPINVANINSQEELTAGLRQQFKAVKDRLHADLTALRDGAVSGARAAVSDVFLKLAELSRIEAEVEVDAE